VKRSCGLDTAKAQLMDESRETGDEADEFTELVSSILRGVGERMERCREVSERCGQKQAQIRDW